MANLIDSTFFVGEINIPNVSKVEIIESLNLFIGKYEKDLLMQLFGYDLWYLFDSDNSTQRFQDLIYGVDNWKGLIYNITDTVKGSLIANYIYCMWVKDKQIWNSGLGTVRPIPNQADVMPLTMKLMTAWNEFSDQVGEFVCYMNNSYLYPEWQPYALWQFNHINDFDI